MIPAPQIPARVPFPAKREIVKRVIKAPTKPKEKQNVETYH